VFGERPRHWPREREDCAAQAQQVTQRAQRAQQLLQLQVFQLQQEKRQLQDDFAQLLQEREQLERRCATFEREQRELGPRLEETKWEVCRARREAGGSHWHMPCRVRPSPAASQEALPFLPMR
jgi:predicted RNase H-like nuclease (RuvC/YqgF family)